MTKLPKWFDIAEQRLGPGDEVEHSWPGTYNEHSGYVVFSKEKLLFVEEEGFVFKTGTLLLETTYDKIGKVTVRNDNLMVLTMDDGAKHQIATPYLSEAKKALQDAMA